jgi:hypothetical protein
MRPFGAQRDFGQHCVERRFRLRVVLRPDAVPPVDLFEGALGLDAGFKGQTLAFATRRLAVGREAMHRYQYKNERQNNQHPMSLECELTMLGQVLVSHCEPPC